MRKSTMFSDSRSPMRMFALASLAWLLAMPWTVRAAQEQRQKWELGIGVTGFTLPDYVGSNEQGYRVLPFPYFVYRGDRLRLDREALRGRIFAWGRLDLDLSMSGSLPVNSGGNAARRGMRDLDLTPELGLKLRYLARTAERDRLWIEWPVRSVFRTDFTYVSHCGWITTPGLRWMHQLGSTLLEARAALQFGDSRFNGYFYGVPPQYATAERPPYDADAGYGGVRLAVGASQRRGRFWYGVFVQYANIDGAAFEDSPLVRSDNGVTAGFGVAWVAFESSERVSVDPLD